MTYNPYELVKIRINGAETFGRPFEFDSEIADAQTSTNRWGQPVKPTGLSTTCPDCGGGLTLIVDLPDPPFPVTEHTCELCCKDPPPLVDPFMSPLAAGRINLDELDPLLSVRSRRRIVS